MLTIRAEQTKVLDALARRHFHQDILARLAQYLLAETAIAPREELLAQMECWHQRALSYGIISRRAIGRFLAVQLTMQPDFDQTAEARFLFDDPNLTGENKMTLLFARMKQRAGV